MNQETNKILIQLKNVNKTFSLGSGVFHALKNVSLKIPKGKLIAITGKSGSGKSTLLNIIAGLDKPTEGYVLVDDVQVEKLSENALAKWRGKNVGVVFQFFQLLPTLTILENVMLPMDFCNSFPKAEREKRALALLDLVKIKDQANKFPSTLSGGQQQRAAIARALANNPPLIIADEPTGNLDSQTAFDILKLFKELTQSGKTVIIVTHEKEFSTYFENTISVTDGKIVEVTLQEQLN
jgi:putative ABC transport system ATP-binding protein